MTAEAYALLPVTLAVRETRYAVNNRPGFRASTVTLVSTLLDGTAYPADSRADLYRQRWQVETDLAHLKTTLGMDVLKCETEAGVMKELVAFAIVYNLVRVVMLEAGQRQKVPPARISFVDALPWLTSSSPGTPLPDLVVNPERKDRVKSPRQKRRAKKYPDMIRPRVELRQKLLAQQVPAKLNGISEEPLLLRQ